MIMFLNEGTVGLEQVSDVFGLESGNQGDRLSVEGRFMPNVVGCRSREFRVRVGEAIGLVTFTRSGELKDVDFDNYSGEMPVSLTSGMMANILRILRMNLIDGKNFHPKNEGELLGSFHDFMSSLLGKVEAFRVVDKADLFRKVNSGEVTDRELQEIADFYTVQDLHSVFYTKGGVDAKRKLIGLLSEELVLDFVHEYTTGDFDSYGFFYPNLRNGDIYSGRRFHKEDDIFRFYLEKLVESVN